MIKLAALLCIAAIAPGCATPTVYMDPKTGVVQQCDPHARPLVRQSEINRCSEAFERMGWIKQ